jgi:hypothetical protein
MSIIFYPHDEDVSVGSLQERLETLMEAAERYKASTLDSSNFTLEEGDDGKRPLTPKDLKVAFNWQEITKLLREIRELTEGNQSSKTTKADRLTRLSEIYEILRSAKMPKLEAVRIALISEAKQLRGGGAASAT